MTGLRLWLERVRNGNVPVRFQLENEAAASLQDPKELVVTWLEKFPDFWEFWRLDAAR